MFWANVLKVIAFGTLCGARVPAIEGDASLNT